jgi:hypothetical protein
MGVVDCVVGDGRGGGRVAGCVDGGKLWTVSCCGLTEL